MPPISSVGQDTFSFKLDNLMKATSQKVQEQQAMTAPVQPQVEQNINETEAANIAYGNTLTALENGQQPAGQTGHALDPARVAALLDL